MTTTVDKIAPHPRRRAAHRAARRRLVQLPLRARPPRASRSCSTAGEIGEVTLGRLPLVSRHQRTAPTTSAAGMPTRRHSGSLFVHKATHHFDLLNWYLDSDPESVAAFGRPAVLRPQRPVPRAALQDLRARGRVRLLPRPRRRPVPRRALRGPVARSTATIRDGCVFREDIDIPDTMVAAIRYAQRRRTSPIRSTPSCRSRATTSPSTAPRGRIELRQYEKQPWEMPDSDEILLVRSFPARASRRSSASPCRTSPAATTAATTGCAT